MNVLVGIVFVGVSVDSFSSGGDGLNCFADQFSKKGLVMTIIKIKIILRRMIIKLISGNSLINFFILFLLYSPSPK